MLLLLSLLLIKFKKTLYYNRIQFERYSFSRLTDNNVFDYIRNYLAAFHLNTFRQIEGKTKISCEIWLKNEGLPIRESLFELYLWFCQERGTERKAAVEDLYVLGEHMRCMKEEQFYKERVRREDRK